MMHKTELSAVTDQNTVFVHQVEIIWFYLTEIIVYI